MTSTVVNGIAVLHIVSHGAICFCDYTQLVKLLDFVTRPDGSASDPNNLLPLELIYAALTAMAFGTVGFAFFLAFFAANSGVTMKGAAAISLYFHSLWGLHMVWKWDAWRTMMHPDGAMQPGFFLVGHIAWSVMAAAILVLPTSSGSDETARKKKN